DGIFWHDGNQLVSYFAARSEVFSTSDSGYPRRIEGFSGQISNSLTVPSRDFDRALAITANHWLRTPSGVEYDSWLRLDGNHEREFRHTVTGSASLSTVVRLPARRSLRILTGFTRASSSGGAAISSATRAANNINVHATPA
ncbi:MAG TPA: hypothetical protein VK053_07170, partial [Jiangellaceae bacterium]|nr:hypothetical protein [Jiangellaceae bacterium]